MGWDSAALAALALLGCQSSSANEFKGSRFGFEEASSGVVGGGARAGLADLEGFAGVAGVEGLGSSLSRVLSASQKAIQYSQIVDSHRSIGAKLWRGPRDADRGRPRNWEGLSREQVSYRQLPKAQAPVIPIAFGEKAAMAVLTAADSSLRDPRRWWMLSCSTVSTAHLPAQASAEFLARYWARVLIDNSFQSLPAGGYSSDQQHSEVTGNVSKCNCFIGLTFVCIGCSHPASTRGRQPYMLSR